MFFYEWTKVKEKRIARKEVWAKLRNWNKIKHEKQKRDNLLWERESERERMRENEREWEREKERALGTNQKERKKWRAMVSIVAVDRFSFLYTH